MRNNCILTCSFELPDTPNPIAFIVKMEINDPEMLSILKNTYKSKVRITYKSTVFDKYEIKYPPPLVWNDSNNIISLSGGISPNRSFDKLGKKGMDSIANILIKDLDVIVNYNGKLENIKKCK